MHYNKNKILCIFNILICFVPINLYAGKYVVHQGNIRTYLSGIEVNEKKIKELIHHKHTSHSKSEKLHISKNILEVNKILKVF